MTKKNLIKILIILGPTSTGKTDLALSLAKKFNGELVSCDSRQVYKGLDIGTGKMPSAMSNVKYQISNLIKQKGFWEINGVKIWMLDVVEPKRQYTVADYVSDAGKVISRIIKRDKLPIIVGGTGFYLKAFLEGLPSLGLPVDEKLRGKLEKLSLIELQRRLQKLSKEKWEKMNSSDRQNPRRLIRAIEIAMNPNKVQGSKLKVQSFLKIGLTAPRKVLYQRSDRRVIERIKQGMIEEAKQLHKGGLTFKRMKQLGLEYGILADYLMGKIKDKKELIKILQLKIHGYIKRQLTWFKKEKNVVWFDVTNKDFLEKVEGLISKWYHLP